MLIENNEDLVFMRGFEWEQSFPAITRYWIEIIYILATNVRYNILKDLLSKFRIAIPVHSSLVVRIIFSQNSEIRWYLIWLTIHSWKDMWYTFEGYQIRFSDDVDKLNINRNVWILGSIYVWIFSLLLNTNFWEINKQKWLSDS